MTAGKLHLSVKQIIAFGKIIFKQYFHSHLVYPGNILSRKVKGCPFYIIFKKPLLAPLAGSITIYA